MPEDVPATEGGKPATLFLSYARADRACAGKLVAALERCGFELWWDARIEGGAQFAHSIDDALTKADAVLVLWSPTSAASDWVRDEAAVGRDRHKLVPLALEGGEPPLGFRQYHAIDLSRWNGRASAPEIAAIARAVAALRHEAAPAPARAPARPSRRTALIGGGVLGAAALAAGGWWALPWLRGGGAEDAHGVVVLPFRNLSGDPEQAYFSQGVTEEVRAALRRIASLKVVAAASSDAAASAHEDAPTIAGKLGVAYILEGSVQRAANVVRIAVDLTEGATGFSKWSRQIDRPLTDIFAVQSEIAGLVAAAMSVRLATAAPAPGGTRDVATYEHFLRGRALFNQGKDEATDRQGLAELDQAVARDPGFALAHAARSRVVAAIAAEYADAGELKRLYADARAAAQRAIDLAPDLPEAQLAMGFVLFTCLIQPREARPFYDRAAELAPGDADILLLFALFCSRTGRAAEAEAAAARAVSLDALNARAHRATGSIRYAARRYAQALPPLARALELTPTLANAHSVQGFCLLQLGDLAGAEAAFAAEPHAIFRLAGLAIVRRRRGDAAGAQGFLDQLRTTLGDSAIYQQAEVLAQWGDVAGALTALERARALGDSGLIYLGTDPLLDPLRREPRFRALAGALGFA